MCRAALSFVASSTTPSAGHQFPVLYPLEAATAPSGCEVRPNVKYGCWIFASHGFLVAGCSDLFRNKTGRMAEVPMFLSCREHKLYVNFRNSPYVANLGQSDLKQAINRGSDMYPAVHLTNTTSIYKMVTGVVSMAISSSRSWAVS